MMTTARQLINRLQRFAYEHRRALMVFGFVMTVVATVFLWRHVAMAQTDSAQSINTGATLVPTKKDNIDSIVFAIASLFQWMAAWVLRLIMFVLEFTIQTASYNNYLNSPAVQIGWVLVRDTANMFFVVILLVIAFGTILGIEQYEYKKMIGKFVLAAVLVNFSHLICGFIIDVAQVFTITFVNGIAAAAGGNVISAFKLNDMMTFSPATNYTAINDAEVFIASLSGFIFSVLALCTIMGYGTILLARMVVLWILIVLSPLAFALGVLPQGQKYSGQWWSQFTSNVIVAPVCVFFLWLCFATIGEGDINNQIAQGNPGAMDITVLNEEGNALPSSGITNVLQWGNLSSFVIALAMLLVGIKVTLDIGAVGSSALQKSVDFGKRAMTGVLKGGKWIGMNAPVLGGKSWINRGLQLRNLGMSAATVWNDKLGSMTSSPKMSKYGGAWVARQLKFGSREAYKKEYESRYEEQEKSLSKSIGMAGSSAGLATADRKAEAEMRTKKSEGQRTINEMEAFQRFRNGEGRRGHFMHHLHEEETKKTARATIMREGEHTTEESDQLKAKLKIQDDDLAAYQRERDADKGLEEMRQLEQRKNEALDMGMDGAAYSAKVKEIETQEKKVAELQREGKKATTQEALGENKTAVDAAQADLKNLKDQRDGMLTDAVKNGRTNFQSNLDQNLKGVDGRPIGDAVEYRKATEFISEHDKRVEELGKIKVTINNDESFKKAIEELRQKISAAKDKRDVARSDKNDDEVKTQENEIIMLEDALSEKYKTKGIKDEVAEEKAIADKQGEYDKQKVVRRGIEEKYGQYFEKDENRGTGAREIKELQLLQEIAEALQKGGKEGKSKAKEAETQLKVMGSSKANEAHDMIEEVNLKKISSRSEEIKKQLTRLNKNQAKTSAKGREAAAYKGAVRRSAAMFHADAWAQRDHYSTFQRAGLEDLRHRAAQQQIYGKMGMVMPNTAHADAAETLGKAMSDMNYEQLLSNLEGFAKAMQDKRDSGKAPDLTDRLYSIALFQKLFKNGWIDDVNSVYQHGTSAQKERHQKSLDLLKGAVGDNNWKDIAKDSKVRVNVSGAVRLNGEQENSLDSILSMAKIDNKLLDGLWNKNAKAEQDIKTALNNFGRNSSNPQLRDHLHRLGIGDVNELTDKILKQLDSRAFDRTKAKQTPKSTS